MLDAIRITAVILGGISFGVAVVVTRSYARRAVRHEVFAARLFCGIHLAVVLFVFGILAERAGEPLSWYTPAALAIFTGKLLTLLLLREIVMQRELRVDPPQRRAADLC